MNHRKIFIDACLIMGIILTPVIGAIAYIKNRPDPVRDAAYDSELSNRDEIAAQALRCFSLADRFRNTGDHGTAARWHTEGVRLARIAGKGLPAK